MGGRTSEPSLLTGSYDYRLVGLSAFLAMCMCYTGFEMTERIMASTGRARVLWLACGATAMGTALWAALFVGTFAFNLPLPILYYSPTLGLALVVAIVSDMLGLFFAARERKGAAMAIAASVVVGGGLATTPLLEVASMRVAARMEYRWGLALVSATLSVIIFLLVLLLVLKFVHVKHPTVSGKIIGAISVGSAVALLPSLSLWVVRFQPSTAPVALAHTVGRSSVGLAVIGSTAFLILAGTVIASVLEGMVKSKAELVEKAQESEVFFRSLSKTIPGIIWTARPDGVIDFASEQWYSYTGNAPQTDKEVGWKQSVHPDDFALAKSKWTDSIRTGEPYETEYRLRSADGSYRWFLARAAAVHDERGQTIKWFGTVTDIDEQKQNQQNLEEQIRERTKQLAEATVARERELYFKTMAEALPEILWTATPDGMDDYFNQKLFDYTGLTFDELAGSAWKDVVHPDDVEGCLLRWQNALRIGEPYEVQYRLRGKDGAYRWFLGRASPIRDNNGKIVKWFGTCTDIENQKLNEQVLEQQILERTMQLADANARLQAEMAEKDYARRQLDEEQEKMMRDLEQRSERAAMLAKMGELLQSCITQDEVIAISSSFAPKVFPTGRGAIFLLNSSRTLAEVAGSWSECELAARDFEISDCWALRTGQPNLAYAEDSTPRCKHAAELERSHLCVPILAQGETMGILYLQAKQNTTRLDPAELSFRMTFAGQVGLSIANIKLRDALRTQSIRDALTGLYNRRYLEEILEREIRRSIRAQQPLGIVLIDLDYFKKFNDAFGHDAGDAVLRETGLFLTKGVRAEDFVCRYGGEEFVLILPTANLDAAQARAEQLRVKMRELTIVYRGKSMGMITISAGVAVAPDHGTTPGELMAAADTALYEAKRNGRDQVVVATAAHGEAEAAVPAASSGSGATA